MNILTNILIALILLSCSNVTKQAFNDSARSPASVTGSCTKSIKKLISKNKPFIISEDLPIPPHNIKEDEWVTWNPENSDAEIARFREKQDGAWGFARLKAGIHSLHTHKEVEWYFVKTGDGLMQLGDEVLKVTAGDKIFIPGNVKHSIRKHPNSKEDLVFEYFFPDVNDYDNTVKYKWLSQ